jgi:hypothetical protein
VNGLRRRTHIGEGELYVSVAVIVYCLPGKQIAPITTKENAMLRLYIHHPHNESPEAIEIEETATVSSLVETHGRGGDALAMLEDTEVTLAEELTLVEAGVGDRGHVHVGPRKTITVTLHFNDADKTKKFPPAATVQRVFEWAVGPKGFALPGDQKPKHTLSLCGTQKRPAREVHVGSLTDEHGNVCFDLIPKKRFEG